MRVFDVVVASVLLILTAPLLVASALLVLLGSGWPIFFGHERVGRYGRPFRCWKIRTMVPDAEAVLETVPSLKARYVQNGFKLPVHEDPRVTPVGAWLRRSHLDELPQLFNVLAGDMSIIGPRPLVAGELSCFGKDAEELLRHKPGIFGAWTSLGRARPSYPERARIELEHVRNRTWRSDLGILLRSVAVVLRGQES